MVGSYLKANEANENILLVAFGPKTNLQTWGFRVLKPDE